MNEISRQPSHSPLERLIYSVAPLDDAWALSAQDAETTLLTNTDRNQLFRVACELAWAKRPASVILYRKDGTEVQRVDY